MWQYALNIGIWIHRKFWSFRPGNHSVASTVLRAG